MRTRREGPGHRQRHAGCRRRVSRRCRRAQSSEATIYASVVHLSCIAGGVGSCGRRARSMQTERASLALVPTVHRLLRPPRVAGGRRGQGDPLLGEGISFALGYGEVAVGSYRNPSPGMISRPSHYCPRIVNEIQNVGPLWGLRFGLWALGFGLWNEVPYGLSWPRADSSDRSFPGAAPRWCLGNLPHSQPPSAALPKLALWPPRGLAGRALLGGLGRVGSMNSERLANSHRF